MNEQKFHFFDFPTGSKKQIIFIIAAVIILLAVAAMMKKGGTEYLPRGILFGEECATNEECGSSSKICKSGVEASCENGCIFGRCTKCVPVCPGESECYNVTCVDSIRICQNGRRVRCANYCDSNIGECTSCTPECNVTITKGINYEVKTGKFVFDAVPCINVNYTERTERELIKRNLTEIILPEGYSVIIQPFKVNCKGMLDITLNVPGGYTDIRALRCRGQNCNPINVKSVKELKCGGKTVKEFLVKEDYLEPKWMPIKIKERSSKVMPNEKIKEGRYNVEFEGDFKDLDVKLRMPNEAIEEAKNPSLKITGTPLIIEIRGNVNNVNSTVTMPYINMEGFEEDSIGMYVKIKEGWQYIGGKMNKESKTITAAISNMSKYLDEKNEIKLALMAIFCVSCYDATLTKVYQPEKVSENMVVLVHGFSPEPNTFQPLIDEMRLTNQPFDVWTFDYSSSDFIVENAKEFMSLLEKNHAAYKNIHIVAHSLGGLIVQEALYDSYLENKESLKYGYLSKVRKVILAGALNEGSPVIGVYKNLFGYLINKEGDFLFNLNSKVIDSLVKGIITPRVPGIDYKVIAGTRPYEFNLLFFKVTTEELADIYEKNDGIITVKSAQHVGDGYIDDMCENYWELNVTHTELIDDPIGRKIIGKIISDDIFEEDEAVLGHNSYFDLYVEDCSAEDSYAIIGKKIREEEALDETGCSCGNGYCGEGENEVNCPSDCAIFLSKENRNRLFVFLMIVLISFFITYGHVMYRRFSHPYLKKLVEYIKDNYNIIPGEGYTHEQIRGAFLRRGWPKRIVDDAIILLKKEFHRTYHKPLKKHVKGYLRKGYTIKQIKKALLKSRWKEELIDNVFRGGDLEPRFRLKESKKRKYKITHTGRGEYFDFANRKA